MQIDFHHATTYAIARIAGFEPQDAEIVAHAAQYVDDSTTSGFLRFENGMRFRRDATAHPMLDPQNLDNDDNAVSWLPFHFLPGNNLLGVNVPSNELYFSKLVCRPDSSVAKEMMAAAIRVKYKPHGLHRLGIAAHVFVDTFAHHGFVGQRHNLNAATDIRDADDRTIDAFSVPPVGHGQVDTCPDRPFLKWSYTDFYGKRISRDNPATFAQAADRLCQEFRRYLVGDPTADVQGLGATALAKFTNLFAKFDDNDGDVRHKRWLGALDSDYFGFGAVGLTYAGKGAGSWKHRALGNVYLDWEASAKKAAAENPEKVSLFQHVGAVLSDLSHRWEAMADNLGVEPADYPFSESFLTSDYKKFHDAASDQRYDVFRKILPSFGIHAA